MEKGAFLMQKSVLFIVVAVFGVACVKPKVYKAETVARMAAEARESILQQELSDRKRETAGLVERVSELSRTLGQTETELRALRSSASQQTQQLNESSAKLNEEKRRLENDLAARTDQAQALQKQLSSISSAQQSRAEAVSSLAASLASEFSALNLTSVAVENRDEKVVVIFPDELIFDKNGLTVAATGLPALAVVGKKLAERPELLAQIVAHTDNVVPKDKTVRDTWDWSMQRAVVLAKIFAREHGANENQMTVAGRGEFCPLASNGTLEGRAQNRRTEIIFSPKLMAIPMAH